MKVEIKYRELNGLTIGKTFDGIILISEIEEEKQLLEALGFNHDQNTCLIPKERVDNRLHFDWTVRE
jgi:hypothetical protein